MIYYIADMHFGHKNVLRFDNRPFADTELMDEVLIHNWNERVTDEDTVYVLGDAFWKNEESSVKIIQRLNGHKHLIRGNHDRVHGRLRFHWESIEQYAESYALRHIEIKQINPGCRMSSILSTWQSRCRMRKQRLSHCSMM